MKNEEGGSRSIVKSGESFEEVRSTFCATEVEKRWSGPTYPWSRWNVPKRCKSIARNAAATSIAALSNESILRPEFPIIPTNWSRRRESTFLLDNANLVYLSSCYCSQKKRIAPTGLTRFWHAADEFTSQRRFKWLLCSCLGQDDLHFLLLVASAR